MPIYGAIPRGAYRQLPKGNPRSLGFERYVLGFDPTIPNYGEIPAGATQLNFTSEDFSIIIRVKFDDVSINPQLFSRGAINVDGYYIHIQVNGRFYFITSQLAAFQMTYSASGTCIDDTWYTLGVSRDGAAVKLYRDGVALPVTAGAHINPATSTRTAKIGIDDNLVQHSLNGKIAFLMAYGIALTADEMRWNVLNYHNPVRRDKLALWLPMEEGAGLTLIDHSGYGTNGALLPAPTPPTWERVKQYELRAETEQ